MRADNENIIDDMEFEQWKSQWDGVSRPPPEVARYVNEVLIKRSEDTFKKWLDLIPKKT